MKYILTVKHILTVIFILGATLRVCAGPDAWLQDGLFKPEVMQQIKSKLQLTADQESKMSAIIAQAREKSQGAETALKEQQQALHGMLRVPETTADTASAQLTKVLETEATLKQIQLRTLIALRDVLTPEQQKKAQTLGAPKVAADNVTESQIMAKANKLRAAIEATDSLYTAAIKERGAAIEQLMKNGDLSGADSALDKLIADSGVDDLEKKSAAPDFSKYETGNTDIEALKQRVEAVRSDAESTVSIPLLRQFLNAKEAIETAKAANDTATIGRILTWVEKSLEQTKSKSPGSKP